MPVMDETSSVYTPDEERGTKMNKQKLLILGGAGIHSELVATAKRMGVETYVTDYLPIEKAPAKQLADHAWNIDIKDCDAIVEECRQVGINGVINAYIDPCQRPQMEICERLGLPGFGTREQLEIFTNKKKFLQFCVENGVDIIPQYREEEITPDHPGIEYPLYVKPAESRGTRGQRVCWNYEAFCEAAEIARRESGNGEIVIEKFMSGAQDMQLTYFMIDGEPYLENATDKYNGTPEEGYQGSVICGIGPTVNNDILLQNVHPKICEMLKKTGLKNTPVFIQGFLDEDRFRVYDPGLRLPGYEYELIMREATGVDVYEALIIYALTGAFPDYLKNVTESRKLNGRIGVSIWIFVRGGTISKINGIQALSKSKGILRVDQRYQEGDRIEDWRDIRNFIFEVAALCEDFSDVQEIIHHIYQTIQILDENGEDMKIVVFDADRMNTRPSSQSPVFR